MQKCTNALKLAFVYWCLLHFFVSERAPAVLDRVDEIVNHRKDTFRRLDEFDARPVEHDLLIHVADAAVRDPPLNDDGAIAEGKAEFVKGIEMEREAGLDLAAAAGDLLDHHRLEDHYLAVKLAEDLNSLCVALITCGHSAARLYHFLTRPFPQFIGN